MKRARRGEWLQGVDLLTICLCCHSSHACRLGATRHPVLPPATVDSRVRQSHGDRAPEAHGRCGHVAVKIRDGRRRVAVIKCSSREAKLEEPGEVAKPVRQCPTSEVHQTINWPCKAVKAHCGGNLQACAWTLLRMQAPAAFPARCFALLASTWPQCAATGRCFESLGDTLTCEPGASAAMDKEAASRSRDAPCASGVGGERHGGVGG